MFYYNYKTLEIKQWSNKEQKWLVKTPIANTAKHEQGIIGECTYYQVSISKPHKTKPGRFEGIGIPLHRIVYAWFNDIVPAYSATNEKLEICHKQRYEDPIKDCHILNLFLDTAKNNRRQRRGAVNQYDIRRLEKYGYNAITAGTMLDNEEK